MDHSFALRRDLCLSFLRGYRRAGEVTAAELDQAAERFRHQQAYNLWIFEHAFLAENHRVAQLIKATTFVPFTTKWRQLGIAE